MKLIYHAQQSKQEAVDLKQSQLKPNMRDSLSRKRNLADYLIPSEQFACDSGKIFYFQVTVGFWLPLPPWLVTPIFWTKLSCQTRPSVAQTTVGCSSLISGIRVTGLRWSWMTDCRHTMVRWCLCTQQRRMNFGVPCWRRLMPSKHWRKLVPLHKNYYKFPIQSLKKNPFSGYSNYGSYWASALKWTLLKLNQTLFILVVVQIHKA